MTPLLSFLNVSKSYPDGGREIPVLDRVSLDVDAGVSVGVYGTRRSGKSTLLRMAAGIELPDAGSVRFEGRDMAGMTAAERGRLLRGAIAFVSAQDWRATPGETVVDHVATSLGSEGLTMREARRRALAALDQVGVGAAGAGELTASLSLAERTRVLLARALAREPRLLVLDEPALMPGIGDRDRFYALLRSAVRERRIALLIASEEMAALQGVGVLMSIADGELCSTEAARHGRAPARTPPGGRGAGGLMSTLELRGVSKHYCDGVETVRAVDGVSLTVRSGEFVALYGPSGSGKTTLLLLAAALACPDAGSVLFDGRDIGGLSEREGALYRRREVGFVFQAFHLMPHTTALDNATIKLTGSGQTLREARQQALPWLERVGLGAHAGRTPEQLSMGERQRVAIARALVNEPRLLLADEPTGNLDSQRSREILALMRDVCHERRIPGLLVTHDPDARAFADRVHTLRDGHLADAGAQQPATAAS